MGHWAQNQASAMAIPVPWPEPCRKWVSEHSRGNVFWAGGGWEIKRGGGGRDKLAYIKLINATFINKNCAFGSLCLTSPYPHDKSDVRHNDPKAQFLLIKVAFIHLI